MRANNRMFLVVTLTLSPTVDLKFPSPGEHLWLSIQNVVVRLSSFTYQQSNIGSLLCLIFQHVRTSYHTFHIDQLGSISLFLEQHFVFCLEQHHPWKTLKYTSAEREPTI